MFFFFNVEFFLIDNWINTNSNNKNGYTASNISQQLNIGSSDSGFACSGSPLSSKTTTTTTTSAQMPEQIPTNSSISSESPFSSIITTTSVQQNCASMENTVPCNNNQTNTNNSKDDNRSNNNPFLDIIDNDSNDATDLSITNEQTLNDLTKFKNTNPFLDYLSQNSCDLTATSESGTISTACSNVATSTKPFDPFETSIFDSMIVTNTETSTTTSPPTSTANNTVNNQMIKAFEVSM